MTRIMQFVFMILIFYIFIFHFNKLVFFVIFIFLIFLLVFFYKKILPLTIYFFDKSKGVLVGEPSIISQKWFLQTGNTCAISAQMIVLSVFGIIKNIEDLINPLYLIISS